MQISNPLVNVGSKYVGNAVKGMYGKLESEGFKAGDEFVMSVREGLAIGSTIVLGDRDVEVTLKRLTQALAKTDLRKLLSSDSEVEKSMEGLLPQQMKDQMKQPSSDSVTMGVDDATFNSFVETMKAKDNVKKIMGALKDTAPEIYEAMVAERDVYMARGLDELGMNVKNGSVETTVAVMGMAHVDGVERYLATNGWKDMTYPCPVNVI
jgi:pheromone shutdown protein TraB